jgi:hypothetical protein
LPSEPSAGSVYRMFAPYACRIRFRSADTFSGTHNVTGNPSAAPSMAYAMPVLPLVESRSVLPGENLPVRRPSAMMLEAARSFTDPPGLYHSAFPRSSTRGKSAAIRSTRTSGVLPIRSTSRRPNEAPGSETCAVLSRAICGTCAIFAEDSVMHL